MRRNIITGIDIGTHLIKVVVAECTKEKIPDILAAISLESKGMRHGYVVNLEEVIKSVKDSITKAEKISGIKIKKAFISIGGIGVGSVITQGSVIISRADGEVADLDIKKALEICENEIPTATSLNRKIIHIIPLQYKLDEKIVLGKPIGMKGTKLEVKVLFVNCLLQHFQNFIEVVEEAGVEVEDVMASSLASSLVVLTKAQKIAGCVLVNIGAETISIATFENNIPISLEIMPIGSTDITNDIALGLKISLDEAEQIKMGAITSSVYPKKKLEEIINARLSDIFELIEAHLKKIRRNELLPAGIIITGGGSNISAIEESAKVSLKIPSKIGEISFGTVGTVRPELKNSVFTVAYGLCIFGFSQEDNETFKIKIVSIAKNNIVNWFKQFLP